MQNTSHMPETRYEMRRAGYTLQSAASSCTKCQVAIQWWKTKAGKSLAVLAPTAETTDDDLVVVHWPWRCPGVLSKPAMAATTSQPVSFDVLGEARWFAKRLKARAVIVLLDDQDDVFCVRDGLNGEDTRSDLISMGGKVRNYLEAKRG